MFLKFLALLSLQLVIVYTSDLYSKQNKSDEVAKICYKRIYSSLYNRIVKCENITISKSTFQDTRFKVSRFNQHDYNLHFTRLELVDYNKEFYEWHKIVTFKYNRSMAVANITFKVKHSMHNKDLQVVTQAYKFYSNEYRIFPMRVQLNYCTSIANNLFGMKAAYNRCGNFSTKCDFEKGAIYHACNLAPDQSKLPPMMPNGEYKMEFTFLFNNSMGVIINGYGKVDRAIKYT